MSACDIRPRKIADGLIFGEGIRWFGDEIILSDMLAERIVAIDPSTGAIRTIANIPERPNGLVVVGNGTVLVASMFDAKIMKIDIDGSVTEYADLGGLAPGYLGDMVMAGNGNLYVDEVSCRVFHGEPLAPVGQILLVRPDGSATPIMTGLAFPNGIGISPDGNRLYLAQTLASPPSLEVFNIARDGALTNRRLVAEFNQFVDGLSIDDEEGVWVCVPHEHTIYRVGSGGDRTHQVILEELEPIACTIGGPDGKTMAITAIEPLGDKDILEEMRSLSVRTSIFLAEVPFPKRLARP